MINSFSAQTTTLIIDEIRITNSCNFRGFPRNLCLKKQHQMLARRWLVREGCRITAHSQIKKEFKEEVLQYFKKSFIVLGLKLYFGSS